MLQLAEQLQVDLMIKKVKGMTYKGKQSLADGGTNFKGQGVCLGGGIYPVPVGSPSRGGVSVHGANFLFDDFFFENGMKTKAIGP